VKLESFASDALEDAMNLAQTKALNSFSFRDCINTLTEIWSYTYEKVCMIDDGFYSTTVKLQDELTHLPPYVRNTVKVYHAQEVVGFNRQVYKEAGMRDLTSVGTFHISGNDLFCKDALSRTIWLSYVPEPPFVTFTKNNRDPRLLGPDYTIPPQSFEQRYGNYTVFINDTLDSFIFQNKIDTSIVNDLSYLFNKDNYTIVFWKADNPYVFITYQEVHTGDYSSYIFKNVLGNMEVQRYNPFDYQGRPSNVKYCDVKFNDYTGMRAIVSDYDDDGKIKELGWTPDTLLTYPNRIMYNYLVAMLAKRFATLNNSTIMGVEEKLAAARYEMSAFLKKDKSGWGRIDNVTRPGIGDFL